MDESFKMRVCRIATENAQLFKSNFIDYEYCIFSFELSKKYVIAKALDSNYLHLVGVNTNLSAEAFFKKCLNQTLVETDFDFSKKGVASNMLKGAVRDKIRVLDKMVTLFNASDLMVQESFDHNKIHCAFASASSDCTLGFAEAGYPKSLLRGNYLNNNPIKIDLIIRRPEGNEAPFSEIVRGSIENIQNYMDDVSYLISNDLLGEISVQNDSTDDNCTTD